MASRDKKSGGDFVLESRHLVGLFLLLVVIFGVVFTLGYLLGRSEYDTGVRASAVKPRDSKSSAATDSATPANKPQDGEALPAQNNSDWDFYHSAEPKTTDDYLQPPPKPAAPAKAPAASKPIPKRFAAPAQPAAPTKNSAPLNGPLIPKGAIMLQVAALQREGDALDLAQALQKKRFPAFVITPGADKYYRVQVGPYPDAKSATIARQDLEAKGFKSIVKR